ncbi:carboxylate-amine ligase [Nitrosophilus kaiyonis]|uniref:carboxylate-amine ligase n=1 Tax=Nitrosophilus kaiyonis TaxID=2930200 RepID=UPI002491817C|nr:YbdK family carboxylate-amine ligase [Nitrosophilus kaiyonis]
MIDTNFKPSTRAYSVGAELEVRLVDKKSLEVVPLAPKILNSLSMDLRPFIHKELLESMVELVTPVCSNSKEAVQKLQELAHIVDKKAKESGACITALGTHAFEERLRDEITKDPRYISFLHELQYVLRKFLICGFHIHVGMPDLSSALRAFNFSINYLPLFLALSASSPFYNGENTGLLSFRTKIFEMLPRAGIPEYFDSFKEYVNLFVILENANMVKSIKDVWWDVRIHPDFGTVELRVCDALPDFERIELLISLFRALCLYAQSAPLEKLHHQIHKQNKWDAARHGLSGIYIQNERSLSIQEFGLETLYRMEKERVFDELGEKEKLSSLIALMHKKNIAQELIDIYKKTKDLKRVEQRGILT